MFRAIAVLVLLTLRSASGLAASPTTNLYVALNGNDQWSGRLAAPNAARTDGPFATITRARDAIREIKAREGLKQPITVCLRGGTYFLAEPFTLSPQDSGSDQCPITYTAYENEKAVLSGGFPVTGWSATQVNGRSAWAAHVVLIGQGHPYFHQLWVNGERRPRPRLPRQGVYRFADMLVRPGSVLWKEGQTQMRFAGRDLQSSWRNQSDIDIVALHFWIESRMPLAAVDERNHLVTFGKRSLFRLTDEQTPLPARFYVENVFEALDTPGQWYLDRPSQTLYYLPRAGETPSTAEVIAPRLSQVVVFAGGRDGQQYVERVYLRGLQFAHTEWNLPEEISGFKQAAFGVPGAIAWTGARNCALHKCTIAHLGDYAVDIGAGCQNNDVIANAMFDLGAGGVKLAEGSAATTVADNRIHDGGVIFPSAVGVWVGNCSDNTVTHNEIHDFDYTGVSVGWVWNYNPTRGQRNTIAYNHIYNIGRGRLSDLGGIYLLGISPGTVVRNNLIHDVTSATDRGRGIYLDAGSTGIVVENNIVYRVDDAAFCINFGRDNIVRNNIFALSKVGAIRRGREENLRAFTFEHNLFYINSGTLLVGKWGNGQYAFDRNLYYDARRLPISFGGLSYAAWQASGQDVHGVVADPRFANPAAGDFTLAPDSPALALGFKPIDMSTVGPQGTAR